MHALRFESGLFSNPASEPIKLNRVQSLCTCTSFYMYLFMVYVVGSSCYDVCPDKVKPSPALNSSAGQGSVSDSVLS